MAVLVILAGGLFHGDADDASVFGVFLIGGALLGAGGGALAVSGHVAPPRRRRLARTRSRQGLAT